MSQSKRRHRSGSCAVTAWLVLAVALAVGACGNDSSPINPDDKTATDATTDCEQLVGSGGGLVARALAFTHPGGVTNSNPDGNTDEFRLKVQEDLFQIVSTGDKRLHDPVGQLVDFLDDPPTYMRNENLMAKVRRAASQIQDICTNTH